MNRFIIVDGLPYLFAAGRAYAVRWDEAGFTVGAEVELASVPAVTYSELSVKAKCAEHLNSIDAGQIKEQVEKPPEEPKAVEETKVEESEAPDFEDMKVADLKKYAEENSIDLGTATKKADIIEAIEEAQ